MIAGKARVCRECGDANSAKAFVKGRNLCLECRARMAGEWYRNARATPKARICRVCGCNNSDQRFSVGQNLCVPCGAIQSKEWRAAHSVHTKLYHRKYAREWYRANKKRILRRHRARVYGMTVGDFEALREAQNNRCAICNGAFVKSPHIDHDHKTGAVRGLLCSSCNTGLGLLRDDPRLMRSAIKYLEAGLSAVAKSEAA